jgi:ABC-type uncharacterized transport system substrate-binding protein
MPFDQLKRREFISLIGGAAVTRPLAARAQQPAMPVIGFIHGGAADAFPDRIAAFRAGLSETGYVEGQNVVIEYHWLEGHFERLPAVLADLIRRRVAVIATPGSTPAAIASPDLGQQMRRRDFITLLGGAAVVWPVAAPAQQPTPLPVVGSLNSVSSAEWAHYLAGFRKGLSQMGYCEGQNVTTEYRWAEGRYDQLPAMAEELVSRKVSVIFASGGPAVARAAEAATFTIPIVFTVRERPGWRWPSTQGESRFANHVSTSGLGPWPSGRTISHASPSARQSKRISPFSWPRPCRPSRVCRSPDAWAA